MANPRRNAAIYYVADSFDPETKGLNGRRVAGSSFLKGFFRHAEVDEFVSFTLGKNGARAFAETAAKHGAPAPVRATHFAAPDKLAPLETVYWGGPNLANELWRRHSFGDSRYSLCGVTHTTATKAVMQGAMDMRAAPQMEWDGIICTSRAVHASQIAQFDMIDAYLRNRFGKVPPRPLMPIIPLGINTDDFAHQPEARTSLRSRMGWGEKDVVVATLSRLTPFGKFDPFPLFIALDRAQAELGQDIRLHFIACGIYIDGYSKNVFEGGARALMPNVSYTHLDGADAGLRAQTLSGADIFTFPIDNIQETFGLAPVEAMAAGLPVVVSDWDGMKDTVSDEVGLRITTRTVPGVHSRKESFGYHVDGLNYAQYGSNTSALTEIDLAEMTAAFVTLARDPDKRRQMGAAGRKRAQSLYDWSAIIPQYQDVWAELSRIRRAAIAGKVPLGARRNPVAPPPMDLFRSYPSHQFSPGVGRCVATSGLPPVPAMFKLRRYDKMKQPFEAPARVEAVLAQVRGAGPSGMDAKQAAMALKVPQITVERIFAWLLKFGYLRFSEGPW